MSKLYINPATGKRARILSNGAGVVLFGKFGNQTLHKSRKELAGEDPNKYWNRYLKQNGYRPSLELRLKEACEK